MADNKKIKLPQHLQLDSVSPATRLLEKRRLMYEVQKAFEDQKEEYLQKEKRFKIQEGELREKDIMIQDNLIKFSTFLQQQEMRKKKDMELTLVEYKKIDQLQEDVEEKNEQLEVYKAKSNKIAAKVKAMKKYDVYLETVKDNNPDEFTELQDIVSRHTQLETKNKELHDTQERYTKELDQKTKELTQYQKEMETEIISINNKMSNQQQSLEGIDNQKSALMALRDEKTKEKSQKTTETGKILMTIDNLYQKCAHERPFQGSMIVSKTDYEELINKEKSNDAINNFDNTTLSGQKAIEQLKIVTQVMRNFHDLQQKLESHGNTEIRAALEKYRAEKNK